MSNKHSKQTKTTSTAPGGWWHNQPRRAHPDNCKCPGCSGARKARGKELPKDA